MGQGPALCGESSAAGWQRAAHRPSLQASSLPYPLPSQKDKGASQDPMAAGLSLLEGSTELGGRAGPSLLSACLMGMSAKGAFVPGSKPLSPRAGVLWLRGHVPVKPVGLWQRGRLPVGRWRRALSVVGEAHEDRRGRCCLGLIPEPAGTLLSPPGRTYVLKLLDGCGEAPGGGSHQAPPIMGGSGQWGWCPLSA